MDHFYWLVFGRDFTVWTIGTMWRMLGPMLFIYSKWLRLGIIQDGGYEPRGLMRCATSQTGEYCPSVVFVRMLLQSVRNATTSGLYSPVRPSRSVSKRLIFSLSNAHRYWFNSSITMNQEMKNLFYFRLEPVTQWMSCTNYINYYVPIGGNLILKSLLIQLF